MIPRVSGACCGPLRRYKELSPGAAAALVRNHAAGIGFPNGFVAFPAAAQGRAQGPGGAGGGARAAPRGSPGRPGGREIDRTT